MSPSWRKRVVVGLAPDQVTALRFSRGLRPSLEESIALPVNCSEPGQWQAAVNVFDTLLDNPNWSKADIDVIISNHFVHYAIVPGNHSLKRIKERLAFAGILFEQLYGNLSQDWEFRLGATATSMATLACGIPRPLLKTLQEGVNKQGKLRSLRPLLMNVFNTSRRFFDQSDTCLAVVETGRSTLVWIKNGQWQNVSSRATDDENTQALTKLLTEETALHELRNGGTLLLCDLTETVQLKPGAAWNVIPISSPYISPLAAKSSSTSAPIPSLAQWGHI